MAIPPVIQTSSFLNRNSLFFKVISICVLVLLLLIPLSMIHYILDDRLDQRNTAIEDITSTWGKPQRVIGPVLILPYRYQYKETKSVLMNGKTVDKETVVTAIANAYFLPAQLSIECTANPQKLYRGIYEAVVYSAQLKLSGYFNELNFKTLNISQQNVLWDKASLAFAFTDLRGTHKALNVKWNSQNIPLTPGIKLSDFSSGIQASLEKFDPSLPKQSFELDLQLNGSRELQFAPVGIENQATIHSPWPDPSFKGAFLPTERNITPEGFQAHWNISYYGRNYPQQWTDQESTPFRSSLVQDSTFGVEFISLIDFYRKIERSIKYGILFIVLVFTAFFLFEVTAHLRIHPFQYILVGAALCLFYLSLLSLSEFMLFSYAYLIASSVAVIMITLYSLAILKSGVKTIFIGGGLIGIYGFLYIILQLQDYALLLGTAGLLIVLAAVMYTTRKIDWYQNN
ncbi:MAG: cell envelope integrity protein CreD [Verrucomicrobiia bacterium]